MKIGFTGTREGMTTKQAKQVRRYLKEFDKRGKGVEEFHHGGCLGADTGAHKLAQRDLAHTPIYVHPSTIVTWQAKLKMRPGLDVRYDPQHPLYRNRSIVDRTDTLLATPKGPEVQRSGTWATVRYARGAHRKIWIFEPDGEVHHDKPRRL